RRQTATMNFGWIEEERLAGCRGPRSEADLAFLRSQAIQVLVRLASEEETGLPRSRVRDAGFEEIYEPVRDFTPPSQKQIDRVIRGVRAAMAEGKAVAMSCNAGYGRTGTMLACYLVSEGRSAVEAIEHLIGVRPVSKEVLRVP